MEHTSGILWRKYSASNTNRIFRYHLIFSILILFFLAAPANAQSDGDLQSLRDQIVELRQSQTEMAAEIRSIKDLLSRVVSQLQQASQAPSSAGAALSIDGRPSRGSLDAPLTIVELSDYQCTYCSQYATETYPLIDKKYIREGLVRYVFKSIPNSNAHPGAFKAHEAAACAGDQNKYWEMHDLLFANTAAQMPDDLTRYAEEIGLDSASFGTCMKNGRHAGLIEADIAEARKGGVNVAPLFAIGLTGEDPSSLTVMRVMVGAKPYDEFEEMIESMLATMENNGNSNRGKKETDS